VTASGWTDAGYEAVARLVGERTGLTFATNRRDDVEAGIRRAMARAEAADPGRYLALVEGGAVAFDELVDELTIGETYFLREPSQIAFLRREVLPEILRRRGPAHAPRVWSAGCSSGEEPYSLAILLEERGLAGLGRVLGSDISRPALARARAAVYGPWSLRGVTDDFVRRYFRQNASGRFELDARIKAMASFGYLNLATDAYPSLASGVWGMDLVVCRNVLIYFDRASVKQVAARLFASLAPGGWLVTGPSDPPLADDAPFETVVTSEGVFYRRGEAGRRTVERRVMRPPEARAVEEASLAAIQRPIAAAPEPSGRAEPSSAVDPSELSLARQALADGDYDRALALLEGETSPQAAELAVRARANRDGAEAGSTLAATLARQHALSPSLHFLHAALLLDLGRVDEAAQALRRVLYLDRTLAMAHFVLGTLLSRRGERDAARRAYERAAELAAGRPPGELLPLGDGEHAGELTRAARAEAARLVEGRAS
jgi:chemotaxis protein methyltransferase CheR